MMMTKLAIMFGSFDEDIREFFPFTPYKIQMDFMKIFYEILTNSNIKTNEKIRSVYEAIQQNENMKSMLKDDINNSLSWLYESNEEMKQSNSNSSNNANNSEEHIICEMKTGSGKSLTMLTPLIYWLFKHKFDLFLMKENVQLKKEEPEWIKESIMEKLLEKYTHNLNMQNKKKDIYLNILNKYFSFDEDKILLKENVTVEKKKVDIEQTHTNDEFPMAHKDEDLLSDCSVEGKTKKQVSTNEKNEGSGRKNEGSGRKNEGSGRKNEGSGRKNEGSGRKNEGSGRKNERSDLYLQQNPLKKIEKKIKKDFSINMIIIGSRKHLCINEVGGEREVDQRKSKKKKKINNKKWKNDKTTKWKNKKSTKEQKYKRTKDFLKNCRNLNELNDYCRNGRCKYKEIFNEKMIEKKKKKAKKKKAIFYSSSSSNSNCGSSCSSSEEKEQKRINNYSLVTKLINTKNVNMNEIKNICRNEKIQVCPYYLSKENIKNADIVLLPYICILNEQVRKNLKINIKNNIVIFDESQNIIENINDSNSIAIENHHILFCKLILKEYIDKYENILNNNNIVMIKQLIIYCNMLIYSFTSIQEDIMTVSKFTILSKVDALNLNNISSFLNDSPFCRRIKIFSEMHMREYMGKCSRKRGSKHNNRSTTDSVSSIANTRDTSFITAHSSSIYLLSEFTNKLIRSNKYDYVHISKGKEGSAEDGEKVSSPKDDIMGERGGGENKNKKRHDDTGENSDGGKKRKMSHLKNCKENDMNSQEKKNYTCKCNENDMNSQEKKNYTCKCNENSMNSQEKKNYTCTYEESDDNIQKLFEDLLTNNNKTELFRKIELISVSACNNFQHITKECSNVILIGGTLQPLEEFLLLFLNEQKKKIKIYSSDYIFKKENVFSRIISTNLLTYEYIDNTFKNRFKKIHLLNLALQIYFLTVHVKYGNIVFFSSYSFLREFISFLNNEGRYVLNEMKKKKYIFFEKKNDYTVLNEYMQSIQKVKDHHQSMMTKNGCILFCVMNAKLSEGINFHDEICRNILIIGIPFFKHERSTTNPSKFTLDKNTLVLNYYKEYSREMLEGDSDIPANKAEDRQLILPEEISEMCRTYELKYAMKIINQCIGRSLRHTNDFSSYFFLDYRFTKKEFFDNFPSFIKTHLNNMKNIPVVDQRNETFLKEKNFFFNIYDDIMKYYKTNFPNLPFADISETHLNNFVNDLFRLNEFHEKMKNA
ncbi:hypothetical protein MKS88_004325 [Plasmodium brasilianum]|uniref:Uncharacterized protein n=1 Tax=Plasmodium brasilianum TaxID=5824 RepID=A0ACB9Y6X5_PLABR|nr:hypothetical protein MKS88_004325 [Plasmodium brasilianum]